METDSNFIDHLLALKDYYQKELEEYERALVHARAQLVHTNALLLDQLERQHKELSAFRLETVAPAADHAVKKKPTPAPSVPLQSSATLPKSASAELNSTPSSATPTSPFAVTATESKQPSVIESPTQHLSEQSAIPEKPEPVEPSATQELLELAAELITPERSLSATTERSLPSEALPAEAESTVQVLELATSVPM